MSVWQYVKDWLWPAPTPLTRVDDYWATRAAEHREKAARLYREAEATDGVFESASLRTMAADVEALAETCDRNAAMYDTKQRTEITPMSHPEDARPIQRIDPADGMPEQRYQMDEQSMQDGTLAVLPPIGSLADTEPRHMFDPDSLPPAPAMDGPVGPTISDVLRESAALLDPDCPSCGRSMGKPNEVVRVFYRNLLEEAPHLVELFGEDLLDGDAHGQRDRLAGALVALANLYDPENPEKMAQLDAALAKWGSDHSAFRRRDGSWYGPAKLGDYAMVEVVLFNTLHDLVGDDWKSEYDDAWSAAYGHAAARMMNGAIDNPQTFGRFVRRDG